MAGEKKNIKFGQIGNALRSAASDHVTAVASDIFDEDSQKYQNAINAELDTSIKSEAQSRTENDTLLNQAIVAEKDRAEAKEQELTEAIQQETARAKAAEEANAQAIAKRGIYDVSAYNGGAVFESLKALLSSSNLSNLIPTSVRCGGMSIRFIQGSVSNSDNNYVKFFCTAQNFTTDVTQWQGVDDEPTAGSDNLVKSGGVYEKINQLEQNVTHLDNQVYGSVESETDITSSQHTEPALYQKSFKSNISVGDNILDCLVTNVYRSACYIDFGNYDTLSIGGVMGSGGKSIVLTDSLGKIVYINSDTNSSAHTKEIDWVVGAKRAYFLIDGSSSGATSIIGKIKKNGGVQNELALGAVYDVSAKNPTAGPNNDGKFEYLSALLSDANLNTLIPTAYQKGGMSIKFIQTDNKYVQYFCNSNSFTTNILYWEKINIEKELESIIGSDLKQINITSTQGTSTALYQKRFVANISVGDLISNSLETTPYRRICFVDCSDYDSLIISDIYATNGMSIVLADADDKVVYINSDSNTSSHTQSIDIINNAQKAYFLTNASSTEVQSIIGVINATEGIVGEIDEINEKVFIDDKETISYTHIDYKRFPQSLSVGDTINLEDSSYSNPYRRIGIIDCSEYLGFSFLITKTSNKTDYPLVVFTDKDNKILRIYNHLWRSSSKLGHINVVNDLPDATKLYFVYQQNDSPEYIPVVIASRLSLDSQLQYVKGERKVVDLNFSYSGVTKSESIFCHVTKSKGVKFSGNGNATITANLPNTIVDNVLSIAVWLPWAFQNVAKIQISCAETVIVIDKAATDSRTESGKAYNLQGDNYNRVSFCAVDGISSITIEVTSDTSWEFSIGESAIINDTYSKTPVCVLYDGAGWNGGISYEGTTINQWQMHEALNIPYGICLANAGQMAKTNQYAESDIESGLAQIVLREADAMSMFQDGDNELVAKLVELFGTTEAFSDKIAVLGQHVFDKKVIRCLRKAGAEIVRGQSLIYYGNLSPMGKDAETLVISGNPLTSIIDIDLLGLPVILWQHGIGTPPSGDITGMYVDGEGPLNLLTYLKLEEEAGNVILLSPSEFINYLGN